MAASIITPEDLEQFKHELIFELKELIENQIPKDQSSQQNRPIQKKWLKSHQVQRLLGISPGTLQTLRLNGTIPFTKIGGVLFYDEDEINKLFESNMRNKPNHV